MAAPVRSSPRRDGIATEHQRAVRRRRVLLLLGALALVLAGLFLTVGVAGSWEFALRMRSRRLAAMVVVGIAVAVATVLFQTVTNNRILTPSIMGFDSLFVLIQTAGVFWFGAAVISGADVRLRFAVDLVLLVGFGALLHRLLFGRSQRDLYVLVLVGVVLGTLFTSLTLLVSRLIDPNEFITLQDLLFASFNGIDTQLLTLTAVILAAVLLGVVRLLPQLDVVALGQDTAIGLGVEHRRVVNQALLAMAVLVGVSTALVGPLTFLGLLVANLARQLLGTHRHAWTVPGASLLAVIALIGGQLVLEQVFGFNSSLSIVINFVGGIVFIALLTREPRQ
ncbi:iron chelate uptake ABC transporter family permease subunit [Modestobacter sp. VKM Ac-2977]|uniref:iron chelate uptake ABC transporter family permease subunit n=1 Tax=Modestobacter sp. VKM Ac-2977 TaxID=3004131 RepID=UPI0022AB4D72|nr:iron chelate uptake ABC transporter family permease subunit [Modestobacter sp. VKM Ac-2977]MCZ2821495.1 iron chelate uptake ABC transporter family permease subunit [Modestobacter sp. VKM Ac-2977]